MKRTASTILIGVLIVFSVFAIQPYVAESSSATYYVYSNGIHSFEGEYKTASLSFVLNGNTVTNGVLTAIKRSVTFSGTLTGTWNSNERFLWDGVITGTWTGIDFDVPADMSGYAFTNSNDRYKVCKQVGSGNITLKMTPSGNVEVHTTKNAQYNFLSKPTTSATTVTGSVPTGTATPTQECGTMRLDLVEKSLTPILSQVTATVVDTCERKPVQGVLFETRVFRTYDNQLCQAINGEYVDRPNTVLTGTANILVSGRTGDIHRVDVYVSKDKMNRTDSTINLTIGGKFIPCKSPAVGVPPPVVGVPPPVVVVRPPGGGTTTKGKASFPNGDSYEGDLSNGKRTGKGIYTWANGARYEGDFVDNALTGKGQIKLANGDSYAGDWVNGRQTGKGVYTWSDGSRYEGEFLNNNRHGYGALFAPNGDVLKRGLWENNKFFTPKSR